MSERPLQPERKHQRRNVLPTRRGMVPRDDRTLKPNANVHLCRPSYSGAKPMVIRILPNYNPDVASGKNTKVENRFEPCRLSADPDDFSDWAVSAPAAKYIGMEQKFTFLLYDPLDESYDSRENPFVLLWQAMRTATRTGEAMIGNRNVMTSRWAAYMPQAAKQCVDKPKYLTFYQALVYQNYDEIYIKGGDKPIGARDDGMMNIVQYSTHAHRKLAELLNIETIGYEGDQDDWQSRYLYGDVVDPGAGKFLVIYNPKVHSIAELQGLSATSSLLTGDDDIPEEPAAESGDSYEERGYSVALLDKFIYQVNGRAYAKKPAISQTDFFPTVSESIRWWDDLLHFPCHEEICRMMAVAYKPDSDMLRYAWRTHSEYFTDEVEAVLRSRTTVPMSSDSGSRSAEHNQNSAPSRQRSTTLPTSSQEVYNNYDDDDEEIPF